MARRVVVIDDDEREEADSALALDEEIIAAAAELATRAVVFLPSDPPRRGRVAFLPADGTEVRLPPTDDVDIVEYAHLTKTGRPRKHPKAEVRTVPATCLSVEQAIPALVQARRLALDSADAAVDPAAAFWGTSALFALRLIARGRLLPGVSPAGNDAWRVGPFDREDAEHLRALAAVMPPTARAFPLPGVVGGEFLLPETEPLLRAFLDAVADTLPRSPAAPVVAPCAGNAFTATPAVEIPHHRRWAAEVASGIDVGARVSLRLETPGNFPSRAGSAREPGASTNRPRNQPPAPTKLCRVFAAASKHTPSDRCPTTTIEDSREPHLKTT